MISFLCHFCWVSSHFFYIKELYQIYHEKFTSSKTEECWNKAAISIWLFEQKIMETWHIFPVILMNYLQAQTWLCLVSWKLHGIINEQFGVLVAFPCKFYIDWARQTTRRHTISIIPPLTSAPPFVPRNLSLLPDIGVVLDCATSDSNVIFFPGVLPCFTNIKTNRLHICIYQCS